jgi:16S rRNA (cytidine1402-2'-O)-methyltransferase
MKPPILYMIPSPLWEGEVQTIPQMTVAAAHSLRYFIVEKAKTARRYLKDIAHPLAMQDLEIYEMDRIGSETEVFRSWVKAGHSVGVISEAGCPGVADPGTQIVRKAHEMKIKVVPCPGPNSIIQALMASGFSGQQFTFHGYLPNKKEELTRKLKWLEQLVHKNQGTQIFIETPYRNLFLWNECLRILHDDSHLSISCQLNGPEEWVSTLKIKDWKKKEPTELKKNPCIFSLGRFH